MQANKGIMHPDGPRLAVSPVQLLVVAGAVIVACYVSFRDLTTELKADFRDLKADMREVKRDVWEVKRGLWEVKQDLRELKEDVQEIKAIVQSSAKCCIQCCIQCYLLLYIALSFHPCYTT